MPLRGIVQWRSRSLSSSTATRVLRPTCWVPRSVVLLDGRGESGSGPARDCNTEPTEVRLAWLDWQCHARALPAVAAMDALQEYLFDLNGFIHIPAVLDPSSVATLLEVSRHPPPPRDRAGGSSAQEVSLLRPGEGRAAKLRAATDTLHWHRAFRDLMAHPVVAPIIEQLCGARFRLCVTRVRVSLDSLLA